MSDPLAYFITFHTYGTWLHGRRGGSVDQEHNVYGEPFLDANSQRERASAKRMTQPPMRLDTAQREVVINDIRDACEYRKWRAWAIHVRTTHVHVVVTAVEAPIEECMRIFKARATRGLRAAGLINEDREVWARHGSTRYLWSEEQVAEKIHYVLEEQGEPMARYPSEPRVETSEASESRAEASGASSGPRVETSGPLSSAAESHSARYRSRL